MAEETHPYFVTIVSGHAEVWLVEAADEQQAIANYKSGMPYDASHIKIGTRITAERAKLVDEAETIKQRKWWQFWTARNTSQEA